MFFLKKKRDNASGISTDEKRRLRNIPRYHQIETSLYGVTVTANDACTLLSDIHEILERKIYQFSTEENYPIIIDCGANIGISAIFFKKLYPEAKIIAFEPDPIIFNFLKKNISNFKLNDIILHQAAVWIDNNGVLFKSEGGHSGHISSKYFEDNNIFSVPSVRLKDVLDTIEYVDMLKIDIEGAECEVLLDCRMVLSKCKYVFVEYHSRKDEKQKLHSILKLFSNLGYRYHILEAFTRKQPFIDTNCMVNMDLQLNIFFLK